MWNRLSLTVAILALVPLALSLPACGSGAGGGEGDVVAEGSNPLEQPAVGSTFEAPAIEFTVPAHAALQVQRTTPIQVQFLVPIDAASVQLDSIVVEGSKGPVAGTTTLFTATILSFFPDDVLSYGDTYIVTLRPGIRAQSGEERATAYAYAFRALEAVPRPNVLHESLSANCSAQGLEMNAAGDGLSLFSDDSTAGGTIRFRRIRGGVPVGAIGTVGPGSAVRAFDVAENGNAQVAWITGNNDPDTAEAFVSQFNRRSDSWGELFPVTPDAGVAADAIAAEMENGGGLVAWVEHDVGDLGNQRALAGQYVDGTGLTNVSQLGASTGRNSGLHLSRRGLHGVVAYQGEVAGTNRVQASRFHGSSGFQAVEFLDPTNSGSVRAVAASPSGHLFVLFSRVDPTNSGQSTWMLSVADPGQAFGAPLPLHQGSASFHGGEMAVGDQGTLTVLYSMGGQNSGVWVRRYTPGIGLSNAAEMTGAARVAHSVGGALALEADPDGNAVAAAIVRSGSGQSVRAALLPVGRPWTLGIVLSEETHGTPARTEVRLALEPSGGAFLQWLGTAIGNDSHSLLKTQRVRTDGTAGPLFTYNGFPAALIANIHLAMTPEGNGLITYDKLGISAGGTEPDNVLHAVID